MKNEAHVIGDRVPNERDLILELKLARQYDGDAALDVAQEPGPAAPLPLARRLFGFFVRKLRDRGNHLALLELNDDQLKDIGLSRCQAYGGYSRYRRSEQATTGRSTADGRTEPR